MSATDTTERPVIEGLARNTYAGFGRPQHFRYYGRGPEADAEGVEITKAEIVNGQVLLTTADGKPAGGFGSATKFHAVMLEQPAPAEPELGPTDLTRARKNELAVAVIEQVGMALFAEARWAKLTDPKGRYAKLAGLDRETAMQHAANWLRWLPYPKDGWPEEAMTAPNQSR